MSGREGEGNLYELLEVSSEATFEEIEASYLRRLAFLDVESLALYSMLDADEPQRTRRALDEAFRTLNDPERRAAYDRTIGGSASYPPLMVPQPESDPSVTHGRVGRVSSGAEQAQRGFGEEQVRSGVGADQAQRGFGEEQVRSGEGAEQAQRGFGTEPAHRGVGAEQARGVPVDEMPRRGFGAENARAEATPERARPELSAASALPGPGQEGARRAVADLSPTARATHGPRPTGSAPAARPPDVARLKPRRLRPNLEIALKPDTVFDGALLRRLRESASASLHDVEEITKITKRYLIAIEADDYAAMPAPVYARGFVCEYAKALGLDPQLVAKSYMALYDRSRTGGEKP